jgi:hypothetical protein
MCRPLQHIIPNLIITRITTHIMVIIIPVFRSGGAGTVAVGMAAAGTAVVVGTVAVAAGTAVAVAVAADGMVAVVAVVIIKYFFRVGVFPKMLQSIKRNLREFESQIPFLLCPAWNENVNQSVSAFGFETG